MYNLGIALGVALVCFVLGALVSSPVAGILPAIIGLVAAYFVLARRTFKQVEGVATAAMTELQTAQSDPSAIDRAMVILTNALPLAKWQFLVGSQLHGQLGQLSYMKANMRRSTDFSDAKSHLVHAWNRDWLSQTIFAVILHEEKQHTEALQRLSDAKAGGSGQALFWGVYGYIAKAAGNDDLCLKVLQEGLNANKGSEPLTAFRDAAANGHALPIQAFSPQWFQFFPTHIQKLSYDEQMKLMGQHQQEAPKPNRATRRHQSKAQPVDADGKKSVYQFPHPRR